MPSERDLETYLHTQIPLSRAMGVRVVKANPDEVKLHFPLGPNLNHRNTVFGGSASAAATLAAWGLVFVRVSEWNPRLELVIQANRIEYLRPISCDFEAKSEPIDAHAWDLFSRSVERRGKGRVEVRSCVTSEDEMCCEFWGTFVGLTDHS